MNNPFDLHSKLQSFLCFSNPQMLNFTKHAQNVYHRSTSCRIKEFRNFSEIPKMYVKSVGSLVTYVQEILQHW